MSSIGDLHALGMKIIRLFFLLLGVISYCKGGGKNGC